MNKRSLVILFVLLNLYCSCSKQFNSSISKEIKRNELLIYKKDNLCVKYSILKHEKLRQISHTIDSIPINYNNDTVVVIDVIDGGCLLSGISQIIGNRKKQISIFQDDAPSNDIKKRFIIRKYVDYKMLMKLSLDWNIDKLRFLSSSNQNIPAMLLIINRIIFSDKKYKLESVWIYDYTLD